MGGQYLSVLAGFELPLEQTVCILSYKSICPPSGRATRDAAANVMASRLIRAPLVRLA